MQNLIKDTIIIATLSNNTCNIIYTLLNLMALTFGKETKSKANFTLKQFNATARKKMADCVWRPHHNTEW